MAVLFTLKNYFSALQSPSQWALTLLVWVGAISLQAQTGTVNSCIPATLAKNQLTPEHQIKTGIFSDLSLALQYPDKVKYLNLHDAQINVIPDEVFTLPNVETLDVSHNKLTEVPDNIVKMKNLRNLFLNNNEIAVLNSELFKLTNLVTLHIEFNKLTTISDDLVKLKDLRELVISNIPEVPAVVWKMHKLNTLRIWNTNLTAVPAEIGQFKHLKTLCLRENNVSSLPNELYSLKELDYLALAGNNFTEVPKGLEKLHSLTYISIADNPYKSIDLDFSQFSKMAIVGCYSTAISDDYWKTQALKHPTINFVFDKKLVH